MNISSFLVTFKIVINHIISLFECFWGRGCWWQSGAEVQCDRWRYCLVGQSLRLNFLSSFPSAVIRQPVFSNIRQRKLWYFELVNLWYALPTQCVTSIRFSLAVMCESTSYRFFMFSSSSSQLKSSFLIRAFKVEAYPPSTGFHISVAHQTKPNQEVLLRHLGNRSLHVQRGYLKRGWTFQCLYWQRARMFSPPILNRTLYQPMHFFGNKHLHQDPKPSFQLR